jgi:hypothetical protein
MPAQPDRNITIAAGATASGAFGTGQAKHGSFQLPGTMTGTTITVNVSNDGTNWTACPLEGTEINPITSTGANKSHSFPIKTFNFRYLQLVSGSTESAERTIAVFLRD